MASCYTTGVSLFFKPQLGLIEKADTFIFVWDARKLLHTLTKGAKEPSYTHALRWLNLHHKHPECFICHRSL